MLGGLWSSGYESSPSMNKSTSNQDSAFHYSGGNTDGQSLNSYLWDLSQDTSSTSTAGKYSDNLCSTICTSQ